MFNFLRRDKSKKPKEMFVSGSRATVQRLSPGTFRGVIIDGALRPECFEVESEEDLLAAVQAGWGGGSYSAIMRRGSGKDIEHLGVYKFKISGNPLNGHGAEIVGEDQTVSAGGSRGIKSRVDEARAQVEVTKAQAEKHKIEQDAGLLEEDAPRGVSSEVSELRDVVATLAQQIADKQDDEREQRRLDSEERRHKETIELIASIAAKKDDGAGNAGNSTLDAIKMIMESQTSLQKTMMESQQRTQESIEKNRADSMSRSDQLTKDMNDSSKTFLQLILERSDKSSEQFTGLMQQVLSDKDGSAKNYLAFVKEAMTTLRDAQSPETSDPAITTLDVVNTMGDRFLSVIESYVQAKGQAAMTPDKVKMLLRQVADEVVDEQKQLPSPEDEQPDVSAMRPAFDGVLRTFIKEMQTGSSANAWIAQAQKDLPPEVLKEIYQAQQAGDGGTAFIALLRKYGSAPLVDHVLKVVNEAGKPKPQQAPAPPPQPAPPPVRSSPVAPTPPAPAQPQAKPQQPRPPVMASPVVRPQPRPARPQLRVNPRPQPQPPAPPQPKPPVKPPVKVGEQKTVEPPAADPKPKKRARKRKKKVKKQADKE